ncbi:hypothetical protein BU24DRAFT_490412 [Aaosphaeria arxii CBS 175.79]|uniref:Wax synthase domain-containing protein n=1 Tax=Aaosphaeria arxii CBS 175.79 TaxID=1450172 RepID=A0A6A5XW47_9PLEO|nr:uncharacterized protein BU24DRAFT_490412 [Aaosphaeria arxii CBS 175.79]KAF2017199.1 hypothetical protein BU24DRAFT_490412 [Aaosphaeria arxii CBS 175.79]
MALPPTVRQLQIPLLYATNIISLGFKPSTFRTAASFSIISLLVAQCLYPREDDIYYGDRYTNGCLALYCLFVNVDWIVLANPDKERWHKVKSNGTDEKSVDVPQSFLGRVWWGARLATTNRYVGWSQEVKNVPVEVPIGYPRWRFLIRKTLRAGLMYVLVDMTNSYSASTPHGNYRGYEHLRKPVGTDGLPLGHKIMMSWLHIMITFTSLEMASAAYSVVAVLTGLSPPKDCPSAFGDVQKCYTIRNAWSLVWHQNCRRICSTPGIYLTKHVFCFRKGSFASKYFQLFAGFFVSACVHGGSAILCNRDFWADDYCFAVFMAQAVAILIEDHVIDIARSSLGLKDSAMWRVLGYVYVFVWFGVSLIPWINATLTNGMWLHMARPKDFFGLGPAYE